MPKSVFFDHALKESPRGDFVAFKRGIQAILGELPQHSVELLYRDYQNASDALGSATNAYLDSPEVYQTEPVNMGIDRVIKRQKVASAPVATPVSKAAPPPGDLYIGTMEIECWCSRTTVGAGKESVTLVSSNDKVYVRSSDREIGRINEVSAGIIGPLLDGPVEFRPIAVFFDGSILHIGDTFTVQTDLFLRQSLFYTDDHKANFMKLFEAGVSKRPSGDDEEMAGYLRRMALMKIFRTLRVDKSVPTPVVNTQVTVNQLRDLYQSAQTNSANTDMPETEAPDDFALTLRAYQKKGLSWMLQRESEYDLIVDGGKLQQKHSVNPLWKEYKWPTVPKRLGSQGSDRGNFYMNVYDGSCSNVQPVIQTDCQGGILADDMGLGKTITTLSLVFSCPRDSVKEPRYANRTTLIILPMTLLSQWRKEFNRVNDNPKYWCYTYYGSDTCNDLKTLLCDSQNPPLVVLTTYGTIQSEWSSMDGVITQKGLFSVKFFRAICDEGHIMRNRSTNTAKALFTLRASRRWVLTGTPIINRLEDLFSLIKFLQFAPWSNHRLWKHFISQPFDTGKDLNIAFELLKSILDPILIRRTKDQRDENGKLLVELPPKEVAIERLKFNDKEQAFYNWLKGRAVTSFHENYSNGVLLKNYSSILTHLLRLRQVCDHMDLTKSQDDAGEMEKDLASIVSSTVDKEALAMFRSIKEKEESEKLSLEFALEIQREIHKLYSTFDGIECSICTGPIDPDNCLITECKHCFCSECLAEHFEFQEQNHRDSAVLCPMCRGEISKSRLFRTTTLAGGTYEVTVYDPYRQSTKISALVSHLQQIRKEGNGDHVIVFSQFTSFLDIIETELARYGTNFQIYRFDGRLRMEQRQQVLTGYENDPVSESTISVMLLSLKAGGVGLNLTVASKAFMMDPHWNTAVESQAIDRLHRVGQKNDVKVVRFIMDGSIEERMLEIQKRKNQIGEALTMTDEERRRKKIEEIQSLLEQ